MLHLPYPPSARGILGISIQVLGSEIALDVGKLNRIIQPLEQLFCHCAIVVVRSLGLRPIVITDNGSRLTIIQV